MHGNVHGALANGQGVALVAFVHTKGVEISFTKRCDPANPHDSAANNVYKTCFGNLSIGVGAFQILVIGKFMTLLYVLTLLSASAMASTATIPETSLEAPTVKS